MAVVVQKYGGSSVADLARIKRVAGLVVERRQAGLQVVVVVSAMGKTTDALLSQAHEVSPNPDRRELDMLLSVGERITMALLAMAIKDLGFDAVSFTGSQSGIITTNTHSDARIVEVRPARILEALDAGRVVIVAGYQGVSQQKEVTTLGRGGSDTTAVALAAALEASACEIYSDVDGVYTADPRLAVAAQKLDVLSHGEMQEMAEAGARVLNAQAVEWARKAGIVIHARKTGDASAGTAVAPVAPRAATGVRAVAHRPRALWLAGTAPLADVLAVLDEHHAPADLMWMSGAVLGGILPTENLHGLDTLRATLAARFGGAVTVASGIGTVSLVGDGLGATHGVLRRLVAVLSSENIPLLHAAHSALRVTAVVEEALVARAVQALHAAFVEMPPRA